ncbi:hypothetical protein GCM10022406_08530 [Hymenobacter algoricola]|uniref:Uncharacterized protein n=2 Tax=Hymenobacter algoricola TaxID=486267 RepID=A0ABP7MJF0_9BACT
MQQYLIDIEYAATATIYSIWHELEEINKLDKELQVLIRVAQDKYRRADNLQESEDIDDYMTGVGLMWDAYFTEDKEAFHKDKEIDLKRKTLLTHEFAIASLSGSLLQMAKQGISIIHGGLANCPNGRLIGTQALKQIIWQGRNQAIHFEEGNFNPAVITCFDTLTKEINPKFNRFRTANLAFDIVELLSWKSFIDFKNDLSQLT